MLLMTERNGFSYLAPVLYALVHRMLYGLACCSCCRFMDVCVIWETCGNARHSGIDGRRCAGGAAASCRGHRRLPSADDKRVGDGGRSTVLVSASLVKARACKFC